MYRIARYEVTNEQYGAFLNAVAATDTYGLYHTSMAAEVLSGQPAVVDPLAPFWRYADAFAGIRIVSEDPMLQQSVMQDRLNESISGYYESRGLTGAAKVEYIKKR